MVVKFCGLFTEIISNASQTGSGFGVPPVAQLALVVLTFLFGALEGSVSYWESRAMESSSRKDVPLVWRTEVICQQESQILQSCVYIKISNFTLYLLVPQLNSLTFFCVITHCEPPVYMHRDPGSLIASSRRSLTPARQILPSFIFSDARWHWQLYLGVLRNRRCCLLRIRVLLSGIDLAMHIAVLLSSPFTFFDLKCFSPSSSVKIR